MAELATQPDLSSFRLLGRTKTTSTFSYLWIEKLFFKSRCAN